MRWASPPDRVPAIRDIVKYPNPTFCKKNNRDVISRKTIDAPLVVETVGTGNRDSAYKLIEAIIKKDYTTVYATVNNVVMNSADISVFWQEIIDSYRDIMVVKNTDRAKEFLDLTELEYEMISTIAKEFTPSMLAYHVSLLENAMADMQRAFNSKRSIAEIALTRMCDAKSTVTLEALALRVDELEREVSMLKLGVAPDNRIVNDESHVQMLPTVKVKEVENDKNDKKTTKSAAESANVSDSPKTTELVKYLGWGAVLERIGELKCSLSVQFIKSVAYIKPDGAYIIRMNSFFASKLSSSNTDLSLLRGIIAEREGVKLCLECHQKTFTERIDDTLMLMENVDSDKFRMYWQPFCEKTVDENFVYLKKAEPYVEHLHVFNWEGSHRYPLADGIADWKRYIAELSRPRTMLLEFMPDGKLTTLPREADALREIIK